MATAYHLEALRKQRILERARKSREQIEIEALGDVVSVELGRNSSESTQNHQRGSDRPNSAQSMASVTGSVAIADYIRESEGHTPSKLSSRPVSAQSSTAKRSIRSNSSSQSGRESKLNSRPTSAPTSTAHSGNVSSNPFPGHGLSSPIDAGNRSLSSSKKRLGDDEVLKIDNLSIRSGQGSIHSRSRGTTPKSSESRGSSSTSSSKRSNRKLSSSSIAGSHRSCGSKAEIKADQVRQDLHKQEMFLRDSNLVMGEISVDEEVLLKSMEQGLTSH